MSELPHSFASKIGSSSFWFVLVSVNSWIGLVFGAKERSTKSHELNTKLVTANSTVEAKALRIGNIREQTEGFHRFAIRQPNQCKVAVGFPMGLIAQQTSTEAVVRARQDLAHRLGVNEQDVLDGSVQETEFPDAALGAPIKDEMSAQVFTPGWRITLKADGKSYEYRATDRQLRLFNFNGENYRI
jgi:hypothetical protein